MKTPVSMKNAWETMRRRYEDQVHGFSSVQVCIPYSWGYAHHIYSDLCIPRGHQFSYQMAISNSFHGMHKARHGRSIHPSLLVYLIAPSNKQTQNPFPPTIKETKKIPGSVCLPCLSKHSINAPKKVLLFKWERFPQFITRSALLMGVIKEATAIQQKSTIEDKGRETFPSIHFLRQHLVCDITFQMGVCSRHAKRAIYIFFSYK